MTVHTPEPATHAWQSLIGGEWVEAADGRRFDVHDPYSGAVVGDAPALGRADARRAIEAAGAAFPAWAATPPAERQGVFLRAAALLEERRERVVAQLAREAGTTFGFASFQVGFVAGLFRQVAAVPYAPIGEVLPSDMPGALAMGLRRPVGVVAAIAPWNAALILSARSIAAPLALGNAVVLKPSEHSPYVGGLLWGELLGEAGLPAGVLNVVTHAPGEAAAIGDELVEHPLVRRINFTGSTATGRRLAEAAGRNLKRVVLELGGSNPLIVLRDAELPYAVDAATFGSFANQGQICMSARRIVVERPIAEVFLDGFARRARELKVGDPRERDTIIGPLIDAHAVATVRERIAEAVAGGARLLAGGEADGPCVQPTVLTDVPAGAALAQHETFGPVVTVTVVEDAEEALAVADATPYGLSAGILTRDLDKGFALAERLRSGIVHVNDQPVHDEPQMPFGGVKDSGWGRFGGSAAIDEFTELRWVTLQSGTRPFPF